MNLEAVEGFVDADEAAKFLSLTRRRILELARAGKLPAHSLGSGKRKTWRFLLSELRDNVCGRATKKVFTESATTRMVRFQPVPGADGTEG